MSVVRNRMRARAIRIETGQARLSGLSAGRSKADRICPFSVAIEPHMADAWYRGFDVALARESTPC